MNGLASYMLLKPAPAEAEEPENPPMEAAEMEQRMNPAEPILFPNWFAGDWACAAELFDVNSGPGEWTLASAIPGAADALLAAKTAVGTPDAVRRGRRVWREAAGANGGVREAPAKVPSGIVAAALALAGRNATLGEVNQTSSPGPVFEVLAPRGWAWQLKLEASLGRLDPERPGNFRVSEFFTVKTVIGLQGQIGSSPAVNVVTVYRQVPASDSPTGGAFRIGLGEVDESRSSILQAIQTATVLPPPPSEGRNRSNIPLATYKTRLLFSPILPAK